MWYAVYVQVHTLHIFVYINCVLHEVVIERIILFVHVCIVSCTHTHIQRNWKVELWYSVLFYLHTLVHMYTHMNPPTHTHTHTHTLHSTTQHTHLHTCTSAECYFNITEKNERLTWMFDDFRNMEWFLSMLRMSITLLSSALALTTSKSTNSMERSVSHFSLQSQHLQHQTKLNGEVSITLLSSVSALTTSKPTNSVERSVSHYCPQP